MFLAHFILTFSFISISLEDDVLTRLQQVQFDAETADEITKAEGLLDTSLQKELIKLTWTPVALEDQVYYEDQYAVKLRQIKLSVDSPEVKSSSNLRQMVLNIALEMKNLHVQGVFEARERAQLSGTFRTTIKDLHCTGTGSLQTNANEIQLEWLLLDCPEYLQQTTEITSSRLFPDKSLNHNLGRGVERRLKREYLERLTSLCRESLEAALKRSIPAYRPLARNQAYMKMAHMESSDSNELLDAAISVITFVVGKKYNDSIPLPDIMEGCRLSVLRVLRLDTGIQAKLGVAHDITSLQRLGNARITQKNVTIDFTGSLIFRKLNIFYNIFRAAVLGLGPTGSLDVTVEPVGVALRMRLDFGERRIFLDSFSIRQLGKTKIRIGGFGRILGHILSELTQFFVSILKNQIMRIVEQRVTTYAQDALSKNTIDQIFTGNITY